jgi:hypothetical protein
LPVPRIRDCGGALLTCTATLTESATRITGPDGKTVWSTDADIDDALSAIVGRAVTLTDTPPSQGTLDRAKPEQVLREGKDAEVPADVVQFGSASSACGGLTECESPPETPLPMQHFGCGGGRA